MEFIDTLFNEQFDFEDLGRFLMINLKFIKNYINLLIVQIKNGIKFL